MNKNGEVGEGRYDELDQNTNNNAIGQFLCEVRDEKDGKLKNTEGNSKMRTVTCGETSLDSTNMRGINKIKGKAKEELITKPLNIIYFNARSIRNKMDELNILINQVKPDIVGIVETWLSEDNFDSEIEIENFNFIRKDRQRETKSIGGGVIMYYKKDISVVDVTNDYNSNIDHIWGKVIIKNSKPIFVGIFYRPPDSTEEQTKFLIDNMLKNKTKGTILMGDFNYGDIDWKRNKSGSAGKRFLKVCSEVPLHQCVKEKTRGKNILDLVLAYEKNLVYRINSMVPLAKSDHNVLNIVLNVMVRYKNVQVECYSYNKANYRILEDMVNEIDWKEECENKEVNEVWENVRNTLNNFKESGIRKFNRTVSNDAPWLNFKIKKEIKKRNNLFKRFKRNGQSYSKVKYICARNHVTKMIREEKKKYERKIISRSRRNRKVFYKYISRINRKNSFKKVGPLLDQNGGLVVEDLEMASLLNRFFVSVFNKNEVDDCELDGAIEIESKECLSNIEITDNDVVRAITAFKEHKSPGVDGITSTDVLKNKKNIGRTFKANVQ